MSSPLLASVCGSALPRSVTSTQNTIYVRFRSDSSGSHRGFSARFSEGGSPVTSLFLVTKSMGERSSPSILGSIHVRYAKCRLLPKSQILPVCIKQRGGLKIAQMGFTQAPRKVEVEKRNVNWPLFYWILIQSECIRAAAALLICCYCLYIYCILVRNQLYQSYNNILPTIASF